MIGNKKVNVNPKMAPELFEREQELRFQLQQLNRALMQNDLKKMGTVDESTIPMGGGRDTVNLINRSDFVKKKMLFRGKNSSPTARR